MARLTFSGISIRSSYGPHSLYDERIIPIPGCNALGRVRDELPFDGQDF
jgi:hypothetical protein